VYKPDRARDGKWLAALRQELRIEDEEGYAAKVICMKVRDEDRLNVVQRDMLVLEADQR
jgi:hypothetical protein